MSFEDIEHEIDKFEEKMLEYWKLLEEQAIWLFVLTIGLISIAPYYSNIKQDFEGRAIYFIAFLFPMLVFIKPIIYHLRNSNFDAIYKDIASKIESNFTSEEGRKLLEKLNHIDKKRSIDAVFKNYTFYIFSISLIFYLIVFKNFYLNTP